MWALAKACSGGPSLELSFRGSSARPGSGLAASIAWVCVVKYKNEKRTKQLIHTLTPVALILI